MRKGNSRTSMMYQHYSPSTTIDQSVSKQQLGDRTQSAEIHPEDRYY